MTADRWRAARPSEHSQSVGETSEENAKGKKETKATRLFTPPPHRSHNVRNYTNNTRELREVNLFHLHTRTCPRRALEDTARFVLQVVLGFFSKNKKTSWITTQNYFFFSPFFCNSGFLGIVAKEFIWTDLLQALCAVKKKWPPKFS